MRKRFEALDAFRGLCALSVVVFHMHLVGSITELNFFRGSTIFVEFFFILSGFVLAHGYGFKKNIGFYTFMKARFFRLYPLHIFMFLVFVILEFGKLFAYKFGGFVFNNLPFTESYSVNEIIPNLLLIQSWTPFTNSLSFNYPSWSISIEFYLYALLFCSIITFKSYRVISWFIISLMAFSLMYLSSDLLVPPVLRGLSCFFGGSFVYYIYTKISHVEINKILGNIIECLLIILIVFVVSSTFKHQAIVASLLFMITVLFFSFESGIISNILKMNAFQYVGKLSYSIYMTHAAILFCLISIAIILQKVTGAQFAPMIEGLRYLNFGSVAVNNIVIFVIISIVVFLSSLTYRFVEVTGQKLNKRERMISKEKSNLG